MSDLKAGKGAALMVASRLFGRVLDFLTLTVLARHLLPADFGMVALAMSVVMVVEVTLELPLSQAIVKFRSPSDAHYATAFTLGFIRALIVTASLSAVAAPFAQFFHEPRLFALVGVLSLSSALRGVASPRMADYARRLEFWPDLIVDLSGKAIGSGIAVLLVLLTRSYWSIAIGSVASVAASTAISYILAPYRPALTIARWRDFAGFLGWNTAAQTLSAINWQIDRLLVGRMFDTSAIGRYTMAANIAAMPIQALVQSSAKPLMSRFSSIHQDEYAIAKSYTRTSESITLVTLPIMIGLSVLAKPIIFILLGSKWLQASTMLQLLALSSVAELVVAPMKPLFMASNQTRKLFYRAFIELLIRAPLLVVGGTLGGIIGLISGKIFADIATSFATMQLVKLNFGIRIFTQIRVQIPAIISGLLMAFGLHFALTELSKLAFSNLTILSLCIPFGASLYAGCLFIFSKQTAYSESILSLIFMRLRKFF